MKNLERNLSIIVFADIVGYTSMMNNDEQYGMEQLSRFENAIHSCSKNFNGDVVKTYGDGCLILFESAKSAIECSIQIQNNLQVNPKVPLRIGIHIGEIIKKNHDVFGDAVNIASRIESMGVPNSILLSSDLHGNLANQADLDLVELGDFKFKNVERKISLFAVANQGLDIPSPSQMNGKGEFLIPGLEKSKNLAKAAKKIAVLPFSNTKNEPETNYLGIAIAEQVITDLSYADSVIVRPSSLIRKYDQKTLDHKDVSRELDVNYILSGSYIQAGEKIRVNFEFVDLEINETTWRKTIKSDFSDVFSLLDSLADHVMECLNQEFSARTKAIMQEEVSSSPLAYEYFLKGISYSSSLKSDKLAIEMLKKAIGLDDNYAPAFYHLSARMHRVGHYEFNTKLIDESEMLLNKALSINPNNLEVLSARAMRFIENSKSSDAIEMIKRAMAINSNHAISHYALGYIYRYTGLNSQAIHHMELAITIDGYNEMFRSTGSTYTWAGEEEKAIKSFKRFKQTYYTHYNIGFALLRLKRDDEALTYFRKTIDSNPDQLGSLLASYGMDIISKNYSKSEFYRKEFESKEIGDPETWYFFACKHALAGNIDACIDSIDYCVNNGFYNYPLFQRDPLLGKVREEPRFQNLLKLAKEKHMKFIKENTYNIT